jgi:predicted metal-dependent hydrolase
MTQETGEIQLGDKRISFTVARSRRRRRTIGFVMESPSALKITAPIRASLSSIRSVLQKQTNWIVRRLAEFKRAGEATPRPTRVYKDGESITYLGHAYRIVVTQDKDQPQGCKLYPHRLIVNIPAPTGMTLERFSIKRDYSTRVMPAKAGIHLPETKMDSRQSLRDFGNDAESAEQGTRSGNLPTDNISQEDIRLEILLWLKKRAKAKFQKRVDFWAKRLGVRYQKMVVANAERRWGSCSAENVIRLSWRLIMAPLPILDYVVVHELCHVRHKNHGPQFWGQVEGAVPEYKARRKRLRAIGGGLTF